jgi:hypothetical protein
MIPEMPSVNPPRKASPTNCYGQVIDGYVESVESQATNNMDVVAWLLANHAEIRKAVFVHKAIERQQAASET